MRKTVLIVEDVRPQAEMLKKLVEEVSLDADIYIADNLERAYTVLMEKSVDVFLIDIILDTTKPGDTSGMHLVERMRTIEKYFFTPVIFITSMEDSTKYAYTDLNCLGYIEKPFSPEDVKRYVEKALHFTTKREDVRKISFGTEGVVYPVKLEELLYIESVGRVICVHMKDGKVLKFPYKTCKKLLHDADAGCLVQCNRSMIINTEYVKNIDVPNRYITLENVPEKIELGGRFKKRVLAEFKR